MIYLSIAVATWRFPGTQKSLRLVILTMLLILSGIVYRPSKISTNEQCTLYQYKKLPSVRPPVGVIVIPVHVIQEIVLN